jgi:hypothetical protein
MYVLTVLFMAGLSLHMVGKQTFFWSPQIANQQIMGSFRKILRYASPQIANPQLFVINLQIANAQISTKYCITLSQTVLKDVYLLDF